MRLSRNRNWGHPKLVDLVERLATTAQKNDGWPGLLVGDLSQPRGGPMLTGHASHQLGLDADVWLTPMPDRRLSNREREDIAATSMLDSTDLAVDPKIFTEKHVALLKRAASFPEVERVLVHPAIKKALCQAAGTNRGWLGKVRPIQGHYYHFHVRIGCPPGSIGCQPQKAVTGDDGCAKEVDEWLVRLARNKLPAPPKPPGWKPAPPKPPISVVDLPADCRMVLESGADGIPVPPEALIASAPRTGKHAKKHGKAHDATQVPSNVLLKPVKDRRQNREARAH
jgi:penicillin-insensitive murein endopeptidase